ncbi:MULTISPECIES: hypothetical protein [Pseudoalteromonas]|uniref:Uncharacterized protein n=1 Tax=Pseudoalteromonas aurantia 208 TaxID=1314867 RepID=A0ABR9EJ02_9GAMM|nr:MULTISPECIES: hypothetical protein [Pseudoalteromonas]MBE0370220.1 hypothetical protein [Pseudoalteromonas aurantia 208]MBQ4846745.1 hypothetical protein [Pseudoalteromonas sp. MMG005]
MALYPSFSFTPYGRSSLPSIVLTTLVLLLVTLLSFPSYAHKVMSGELAKHLKAINYGSKSDDKWVQPSLHEQQQFEAGFAAFISQNYPLAQELVAPIGYDVAQFFDTNTQTTYYLLQERATLPSADFRGGGTYIYNPNGLNAILQAPHPKRDSFTGTQAIDAFLFTETKLLMLAGTRRDSSHALSSCTNGHYEASDVAHQTDSYFNVVHKYMSDFDDNSVFIQYHGFGKTTLAKLQNQCMTNNDLMLNLSESVNYNTTENEQSILHSLRRAVEEDGKIAACVYGNDTKSLGGTWNVQARYTNGSANICSTSSTASSKRFIHLEQSYNVRKFHRDDMQKYLKKALENHFL